jgi:hypothetical protein
MLMYLHGEYVSCVEPIEVKATLLIALFSSFTSEVYSYLNILYTLFQHPLNRYYKTSTAQL